MISKLLKLIQHKSTKQAEIAILKQEVLTKIFETNDSIIKTNKVLKKSVSADIFRAIGGQ